MDWKDDIEEKPVDSMDIEDDNEDPSVATCAEIQAASILLPSFSQEKCLPESLQSVNRVLVDDFEESEESNKNSWLF